MGNVKTQVAGTTILMGFFVLVFCTYSQDSISQLYKEQGK